MKTLGMLLHLGGINYNDEEAAGSAIHALFPNMKQCSRMKQSRDRSDDTDDAHESNEFI